MTRNTRNFEETKPQCICLCLPCIACFVGGEKCLSSIFLSGLWICVKTQEIFNFFTKKCTTKKAKIEVETK